MIRQVLTEEIISELEAYIKICSKLLQGQHLQSPDVRTDLEFSQDKECQCRWKLEMVVEY